MAAARHSISVVAITMMDGRRGSSKPTSGIGIVCAVPTATAAMAMTMPGGQGQAAASWGEPGLPDREAPAEQRRDCRGRGDGRACGGADQDPAGDIAATAQDHCAGRILPAEPPGCGQVGDAEPGERQSGRPQQSRRALRSTHGHGRPA